MKKSYPITKEMADKLMAEMLSSLLYENDPTVRRFKKEDWEGIKKVDETINIRPIDVMKK